MQKSVRLIYVIFLIIAIILAAIFINKFTNNKNSVENNQDVLETMIEQKPEEKEIIEPEEETDELVTQEYEIDGKTYEVIAILYIPTLDIQYPVFSSTSKELLKVSLNKYWGPNPNKKGNFCIIGHNYNTDIFFGKLNQIQIGDYVQLTDMTGKMLQYKVYDTYIVDPEDTSCTSQLTEGETELTLITCTKDFKQRFIVKARADKTK